MKLASMLESIWNLYELAREVLYPHTIRYALTVETSTIEQDDNFVA